MTGGHGPDACIDAVGLEAHGTSFDYYYDKAKTAAFLATDRALRAAPGHHTAAARAARSPSPAFTAGFLDKVPLGAAFHKGLTMRMGQTHMMRYMAPLLDRIARGEIDPSFVITHRLRLEDAPGAYRMFRDKRDECIKVVMKP